MECVQCVSKGECTGLLSNVYFGGNHKGVSSNGFGIDGRFFNGGNRIVFSGSHSLYLVVRMGE